MTLKKNKLKLEEFREEALDVLKRIGKDRTLDAASIDAVASSSTPHALIDSIENVIRLNGIDGPKRGRLELIQNFAKAMPF